MPRLAGLGYTVGAAVRYGVARGLFTNEAGLGTSGIAAACGEEKISPEEQGLISMTATFWDTVVLCAVTGIVVVIYQAKHAIAKSGMASGLLVKEAFAELPLGGTEIIGVATVAFAVATLIGWSLFGKVAAEFLGGKQLTRTYQYIYVIMIFAGAVMPLGFVWEITGFCQFIFAGSLGVHIALLPENTPEEVEKGFLFVRNFPLVVSDNS